MVEGRITRGTTGVNRLRRVDRFLAAHPALRRADRPLVVDLGYGREAWTAVEMADRLRRVRADVEVVGLEIDPDRVAAARPFARPGLHFARGGFEVPLPGRRGATLIRAMNVLRQYGEDEVTGVWDRLVDRLEPGGALVDGTCDEIGRICSWVEVTAAGPRSLTVSLRLDGLERPGVVAERLPKALIHRNVPGEGVHAFVAALDEAWLREAPRGVYGPSQRWRAAVLRLQEAGWPLVTPMPRLRLGEVSVAWSAVAPG